MYFAFYKLYRIYENSVKINKSLILTINKTVILLISLYYESNELLINTNLNMNH